MATKRKKKKVRRGRQGRRLEQDQAIEGAIKRVEQHIKETKQMIEERNQFLATCFGDIMHAPEYKEIRRLREEAPSIHEDMDGYFVNWHQQLDEFQRIIEEKDRAYRTKAAESDRYLDELLRSIGFELYPDQS